MKKNDSGESVDGDGDEWWKTWHRKRVKRGAIKMMIYIQKNVL